MSPDMDCFGVVTTGGATPVFLTGGGRGLEVDALDDEPSKGGGNEARATGAGSSPRAGSGGGAASLPTVKVRLRDGSLGGASLTVEPGMEEAEETMGLLLGMGGGGSVCLRAGKRGGLAAFSRTAIPEERVAKIGLVALDTGGALLGPSSADSSVAGSS
jgi:hypothetical protein